jgi:hypothetical protein
MRQILSRIKSFIRIDRKRRIVRKQGGYVVIALAAIGLFGGIAAAAPVLNRAVGSLKANDASPSNDGGARAAAEHAMWRLKNEYALWDSMIGEPPSTSYDFEVLGSSENAEVDIIAMSAPPANPFRVEIVATPDNARAVTGFEVFTPWTWPQVTFTLTLTNDDIVDHQVDRVMMYSDWAPLFKSNSVSGMTTSAPTHPEEEPTTGCLIQENCTYIWNFVPVTVPAFGGEAQLTWTGYVRATSGWHFMPGDVHVVGYGVVTATDIARVRVGTPSGLTIQESVTPTQRSAGADTVYDYTITVTNNSGSVRTVDWLKHWSPPDLEYVELSSQINGADVADPGEIEGGWLYQFLDYLNENWFNYDSRDRYLWDISPTQIQPGQQMVLTFKMQGDFEPGIYHSRAEVLVNEAPGGTPLQDAMGFILQLPSASTGEAAEITISQGFTVTAEHDGRTVIISGYILPGSIQILSWKED